MALLAKRVPGRKEVVESNGAPNNTVWASSKDASHPINVSIFAFITTTP
jgi:hypothetical protein